MTTGPPERADLRSRSLLAGATGGLLFGGASALLLHVGELLSWPSAVATGVAGGALFGALLGPALVRQLSDEVAAAGSSETVRLQAQHLLSMRAAVRGRVEVLPAEQLRLARTAALRLGRYRLQRMSGRRSPALLFTPLALIAALQLVGGPWWWASSVVLFSALSVMTVLQTRWLRRRVAELGSDQKGVGLDGGTTPSG